LCRICAVKLSPRAIRSAWTERCSGASGLDAVRSVSGNLLRNAGHPIRSPLRAVSNDWAVATSLLPSQPLGFQFLRSCGGILTAQRLVALPVFRCAFILTAVRYA